MPDNPALAHVLANLAACRAALANDQTISGQPARGLILPPADEDPGVARRIAMYERWLARHAPTAADTAGPNDARSSERS